MAKLTSPIQFSGSLDGLSVYKMSGVDKPVVRRKGGAPRDRILHDSCFKNTRRNLGEFGGRGPATRCVLQALGPLRPGLGTTGKINKILSVVQKLDAGAPWGQRAVALSRCPGLLQGLNIARRLPWEQVVRGEFVHEVDRGRLAARLEVPPLLPGLNCDHPKTYSYFRAVAVLGLVPDLYYHKEPDAWAPEEGYTAVAAQHAETPWMPTARASEAAVLELALPAHPGVEGFSLLLSAAIQYGRPGITGDIEPLLKAVASRILVVE